MPTWLPYLLGTLAVVLVVLLLGLICLGSIGVPRAGFPDDNREGGE